MGVTQDLAQFAAEMQQKLPEDVRAVMAPAGDEIAKLGIEDRSLSRGHNQPRQTYGCWAYRIFCQP